MFLYASSCLTDLLDGMIARKLNATSDFGAFLDPVADKVRIKQFHAHVTANRLLCATV